MKLQTTLSIQTLVWGVGGGGGGGGDKSMYAS